ncbi:M10 family metallopeptidase C-terminal domain-containing protein [Alysiella crassa]|uniref:Serralysin C n=1 Tax=Alysiella crassa TaxID=153491 RepID=A0A376BLZ2_9NEIS|nr:M10 family metallopeptidase C-terminal domain-containing protein [Alysiella crassa]UOP07077.1 hypothetical protein LVJ80_00935 [Alysiella crassa]SSY70782.1 Serralysin C precursor [Alysiella crassa]
MKIKLKITQNGNSQLITLNSDEIRHLHFNPQAQYQFLDEQNRQIENMIVENQGQSIAFSLPENTQPIVILNESQGFQAAVHLPQAVAQTSAVKATEVGILSLKTAGLSLATLVGVGAAASAIAAKSGKKSDEKNTTSFDDKVSANEAEESRKAEEARKDEETRKQQAAEELKKNPPEIQFDNITDDNIINIEEAKAPAIAFSGSLKNAQQGDVLTVKIGETSHIVPIVAGKFSVNIDGKTLAIHREIGAELTRNGEKIAEKTHAYQVDTQIDTPQIIFRPITDDNIVNLNESKGKITVGGTVENANEGDEIVVSCGCPTCTGTQWVDIKTKIVGGTFSVDFNGADLVANNGKNIIKASVSTADNAKNTATGTAQHQYEVDIEPPKPSFVYEKVGNNGVINQQLAQNDIVLKGKVIDLGENETVAVKVSVNGKDYVASKNGEYYQVSIASSELANGLPVKWHLTAKDKAGNETIIEQNQSYTYDVTLNQPTIDIANNHQKINLLSKDLSLSGSLQFDDDVDLASVKVKIVYQNQDYVAQVDVNRKTWSASLPQDVIKQNVGNNDFSVQVSLADKAGNIATNQTVGDFTVDLSLPNGTPLINANHNPNTASNIIKINNLVEIDPSDTVRLTGKLKLDGINAQYYNPLQFQSFVATLNGKEYAVGINNNNSEQRFYLDISVADLQAAKGQEMAFLVKGGLSVYYLENNRIMFQNLPQLDKTAYVWDDNPYLATDSVVKNDFVGKTTLVEGEVSGSLKTGDKITLQIGNQSIETKVLDNQKFAVSVENSILKQADTIIATADNAQSEYTYQTPHRALSGDLVVRAGHRYEDAPYFIKSIVYQGVNGHLKKHPVIGEGGGKLTYAFHKEYYGASEWTENNRNAVKKAFDILGSYINVQFEQIEDNSGFDHGATVGADIQMHHTPISNAGQAWAGGEVMINSTRKNLNIRNGQFLLLHEISHSLGTKHPHEGEVTLTRPLEDQTGLTVMSYNTTKMDPNFWDLRIFDIAYLQYRYGVNPNKRIGNDTYTFKTFNPQVSDGDIYIWDGGGVDTFDASHEQQGVTVDLTPGSWIHRGEKTERLVVEKMEQIGENTYFDEHGVSLADPYALFSKTFGKYTFTEGQAFIGYGTQLERLIGSNYDDVLKGNVADNDIYGGAGNDKISGDEGDDYLVGGKGNDVLTGGDGKDVFAYKLSDFVDGFVDTITDFEIGVDKIELAISGLNQDNLAQKVSYNQATGALSYDGVQFATLENKAALTLDETHFILG